MRLRARKAVIGMFLASLLVPPGLADAQTTVSTSLRVPRPLFAAGKPGPQYKVTMFGLLRSNDPQCRTNQPITVTIGPKSKTDMTDAEGEFHLIFKVRGSPKRARTRFAGAADVGGYGYGYSYGGVGVTCAPSQGPTKKVHPPGKKGRADA